jgi:hypothetical protein
MTLWYQRLHTCEALHQRFRRLFSASLSSSHGAVWEDSGYVFANDCCRLVDGKLQLGVGLPMFGWGVCRSATVGLVLALLVSFHAMCQERSESSLLSENLT